ncbi:MAG: hypothetical protein U9M92_03310 [Patescibacteria group bacterium]|nr:hypothetical protein [Patescibacteria group bacterium]
MATSLRYAKPKGFEEEYSLFAVLLIIFVVLGATQGDLTPTITIKGIAASLVGLIIGAIYSKFSKEKPVPKLQS